MASVFGSDRNDRIVPGQLGSSGIFVEGDFSTGAEADDIRGLLGNDTIEAAGDEDLVFGDLQAVQAAGVKAGADNIKGQDSNDFLFGDSREFLAGAKGGNDTIEGGDGNDRIHGDVTGTMTDSTGGADKLFGDGGDDRIIGDGPEIFGGRGGKDIIDGGVGNDFLIGDAGGLTGVGILGEGAVGGDDTLKGGDGDDQLLGDAETYSDDAKGGKDKLDGGDGNDRLDGGRGDDLLVGGDGLDTFVIGRRNGNDVIKDLTADDVLDLSQMLGSSPLSSDAKLAILADGIDASDPFVKSGKKGLKVDLGQLFETDEAGTLLLVGVRELSVDQIIAGG